MTVHRHVLELWCVRFFAHVVERETCFEVVLSASHQLHFCDGFTHNAHNALNNWVWDVVNMTRLEAYAKGKHVSIHDRQHLMTT